MNTYICILRGINVSGHRIIKMDALRNLFQKLLFQDIQTYIQSGNVIFKSDQQNKKQLEESIQSKILEVFGFEVSVLVKSIEELTTVFDNNPFIISGSEDVSKLHVTFLSNKPDEINIESLSEVNFGSDKYKIINDVVYIFCPENGYGKSKLSNQLIESKLKVNATTRNWKTITQLLDLVK